MITNGAAMRQIQASNRDWYRITNRVSEGGGVELFVYGEIGWDGVTADDLIRDLAAIDSDNLTVRINSPGGSVFGGIAIYNALRTHPANVTVLVDSISASIASVIAQAGDLRRMVQHSQMMIHEAQGIAIGAGSEIREYADLLDKQTNLIADIYADRSGKSSGVFRALMNAETWFTAEEAVAEGLADEVYIPERREPDAEDAENVTPTTVSDMVAEDLEEDPPADNNKPQTVDFSDLIRKEGPFG